VKAEHETLAGHAAPSEGEIDERTFDRHPGVETEPAQEEPDQKSSESASNVEEIASQSSTKEPIAQRPTTPSEAAILTTEAEATEAGRIENNPPTDSPEERREWAATGP
jgi:hypothetical protein